MITNLIYLLLTTIFTLVTFKVLLNNKKYIDIYDYPDSRKIHSEKILKVGGIGIIFSSLLMLCFYRLIFDEPLFEMSTSEIPILFSTIFLVIGGFLDDLISLNAIKKLFFQLIAISIIIKSGFIFSLTSSNYLNIVFTIALFIVSINSMNLIDGIDGLSSGIFLFFSLSMLILLLNIPAINSKYYIVISIFLGSITAFFITNFPPAKLFLGDTGSQLLGWVMTLSIVHLSSFFENNFQKIYLLSFLSIPLYDVFFIMLIRFYNSEGKLITRIFSVAYPDQNHIHHSLLKNNFNNNSSLLILLTLFFILSLFSLIPIFLGKFHFIFFMIVLIIFILFRVFFKKKEK